MADTPRNKSLGEALKITIRQSKPSFYYYKENDIKKMNLNARIQAGVKATKKGIVELR